MGPRVENLRLARLAKPTMTILIFCSLQIKIAFSRALTHSNKMANVLCMIFYIFIPKRMSG